ncbi:hypothetical protein [Rhodococcus sp. IEGM 1341]|uniref:hypothetical protein n=1 Tax=Rhodococcus sp. IEGM 1341 TaxID=3047090 RepID=UPI0024B85942|nr:hypothetical protein [Rhodococcus sp. IEGM 1341]MDI9924409.1 hypothetical protein [Rhodococcus sp. IEGM 1341]
MSSTPGLSPITAVLGYPATKLSDAPRGPAHLGAYGWRSRADEFLNRGQITVHQFTGVRGTEQVLSRNVRRTLFQDDGEQVAVEFRLNQQRTRKIRVDGQTE